MNKIDKNLETHKKSRSLLNELMVLLVAIIHVAATLLGIILGRMSYDYCMNIIEQYAVGIVDRVFMYVVWGISIVVILFALSILLYLLLEFLSIVTR